MPFFLPSELIYSTAIHRAEPQRSLLDDNDFLGSKRFYVPRADVETVDLRLAPFKKGIV